MVGILRRHRDGNLGHIVVQGFWVQGVVQEGRAELRKAGPDRNPAELTNHVSGRGKGALMAILGFRVRAGPH